MTGVTTEALTLTALMLTMILPFLVLGLVKTAMRR